MRILALFLALTLLAKGARDPDLNLSVPVDMRDVAAKAEADYDANRYESAAAGFQSIADRHPDSVFAWSKLGDVRQQQERLDDAVHAFRQAVKLSPDNSRCLINLGWCLFQLNDYSAAITPLQRAEKIRPGNSNIHALLASCYDKVGRDDDVRRERQIENVQQMETFR